MKQASLFLALCIALTGAAHAQGGMGPGPGTVHSAGGGGGFALVGQGVAVGVSGGTTAAFDASSAAILVASTSVYGITPAGTVTSSPSNTWTCLTPQSTGESYTQICYVISPSTSGAMTVSYNGVAGSVYVTAWSDSSTPVFDAENGAYDPGSTAMGPYFVAPAVTVAVANSLCVTSLSSGVGSGVQTIDSSYTIPSSPDLRNTYNTGVSEGGAQAYKIVTGATSPIWTLGGSAAASSAIACFSP